MQSPSQSIYYVSFKEEMVAPILGNPLFFSLEIHARLISFQILIHRRWWSVKGQPSHTVDLGWKVLLTWLSSLIFIVDLFSREDEVLWFYFITTVLIYFALFCGVLMTEPFNTLRLKNLTIFYEMQRAVESCKFHSDQGLPIFSVSFSDWYKWDW